MQSNTIFSVLEIIAVIIVSLALLRFISRRVQLKAVNRITGKLASENILTIASNANFFGQKSKGMVQVRGNGVWLVTNNQVYFEMFLPRRIFKIRLNEVTGTRTEASFLGKRVVGVKLLVIEFINEYGSQDEMAWALSDAKNRAKLIMKAKSN